jgi:elongation factor P
MAGTINFGELKKGFTLEIDDEAYLVIDFKHVYMQQRAPTLTLKLKQLRTGKTLERKIPGSQRLTLAEIDSREAQFLYDDGSSYVFMDTESYDQFPITYERLEDQIKFLTEGDILQILFYKGGPVKIDLPNTVDLEILDTPPAHRGDTATSGNKPATLSTGLIVKVPMHVITGQTIRVDTRNGEYVSTI